MTHVIGCVPRVPASCREREVEQARAADGGRCAPDTADMPFDGRRMIHGGFEGVATSVR